MNNESHEPIAFIRELCKHKTEEEIREAEWRFREYLKVVKDICEQDIPKDTALDQLERGGVLSKD